MSLHPSLTGLVHGPSKAGKSLLAVSTPAPRVLFDVEAAARFLPIKAVQWDTRTAPPEPDGSWDTAVVSVRQWSDAMRGLEWLLTGQHGFRSGAVDSVSELQYRALEDTAGANQLKLQDWGTVLRMLGQFLRGLRDLTVHPTNPLTAVVATAMTRRDVDGRWCPHLQGQMRDVIPYLMDVTAYLDVVPGPGGVETRELYTRKSPRWLAGERVGGRIPAVLQLPDVSGASVDEIAAKNIAWSAIIDLVYAQQSSGISSPAAVDTTPSPYDKPVPQPE